MAAQSNQQKFFEIIKPHSTYEFVANKKYWIGTSVVLTLITLIMLPLNAFVFKSRGHVLNWGVDFRGGTEMVIEFAHDVDPGKLRQTLAEIGHDNADVVRYDDASGKVKVLVRIGAVSVLSAEQAQQAESALTKQGEATLKKFEWTEGGDKVHLRYDRPVTAEGLVASLKGIGVNAAQIQPFGRLDENRFEVTLVSIDKEIWRHLDEKLGAGTVVGIPKVESVGAKAGKQLQLDGVRSLLAAILLIMVYILFRFDFRYAPGTVVALLHDAIIAVGAFAVTYKEFSLTTLAAILTIIGFSMNDTIVVFDRIRENAARMRDRKFDRIVNISINETLSRTIWTSATVFFVTLAMNVFGVGIIRDFAFAMNVGVIVGTYSSIFIASPILITLNDRYMASQKQAGGKTTREARRPKRNGDELDEAQT